MLRPFSLLLSQTAGATWIGTGLCVVLSAQVYPVIPVAAAMMLIGYGATHIIGSGTNRSQLLLATNLVVYATLGCFAIASQSHAAMQGPMGHISLLLWLDQLTAILLLTATAKWVVGQLELPTAKNR